MKLDVPLNKQLIFVYENSLKWKPHREKGSPPPICIVCQTKIIRHSWSEREERQRRTGDGEISYIELKEVDSSNLFGKGKYIE